MKKQWKSADGKLLVQREKSPDRLWVKGRTRRKLKHDPYYSTSNWQASALNDLVKRMGC